jgi:hypothetical protein
MMNENKIKTFDDKIGQYFNQKTDTSDANKFIDLKLIPHSGKLILIEIESNGKTISHTLDLPEKYRANSDDNPITVLIITKRGQDRTGMYSPKTGGDCFIPGWNDHANIIVATWPEKKILGYFSMEANPPDEVVRSSCPSEISANIIDEFKYRTANYV